MPVKRKYYVEYVDTITGDHKFFMDKLFGGIKEFSTYESALRIKNWFLDKGFDDVMVKEVCY